VTIKIKTHNIDFIEKKFLKKVGNFYLLEMEGTIFLEDLLKLIKGESTGIIILINGISTLKSDTQLREDDSVEMFRLYAGG
jgi:hypothetical protein